MTFVDTSARFAIFVQADKNAQAVNACLGANEDHQLVTTDYIIDELLTLLRTRNESDRAVLAGQQPLTGELATVEFVHEADFRQAWEIFRKFTDKNWSFTDCTSRVVMERIGADTALAFDEHFARFGTITVVP